MRSSLCASFGTLHCVVWFQVFDFGQNIFPGVALLRVSVLRISVVHWSSVLAPDWIFFFPGCMCSC